MVHCMIPCFVFLEAIINEKVFTHFPVVWDLQCFSGKIPTWFCWGVCVCGGRGASESISVDLKAEGLKDWWECGNNKWLGDCLPFPSQPRFILLSQFPRNGIRKFGLSPPPLSPNRSIFLPFRFASVANMSLIIWRLPSFLATCLSGLHPDHVGRTESWLITRIIGRVKPEFHPCPQIISS